MLQWSTDKCSFFPWMQSLIISDKREDRVGAIVPKFYVTLLDFPLFINLLSTTTSILRGWKYEEKGRLRVSRLMFSLKLCKYGIMEIRCLKKLVSIWKMCIVTLKYNILNSEETLTIWEWKLPFKQVPIEWALSANLFIIPGRCLRIRSKMFFNFQISFRFLAVLILYCGFELQENK